MTVLALDWNATRVRAVLGPGGAYPLPVPLDAPSIELALAIDLDLRAPQVGASALRRSRSNAPQVCQAFLPYLTDKPGQGPRWQSGRHALDSHSACALVWRKLHGLGEAAHGIVLAVPDYFRPVQAETLGKLGERQRLPVLGSVPMALAAARAGHAEHLWQRTVLVVDIDDHALTLGWVNALADRAHLLESRAFPHLGLHVWSQRLIDALSDRFVLEHRRDPRDVPAAEQNLFDQLDVLTDAALGHQAVQLGVQSPQWFKHLVVRPDQTVSFCRGLVQKVVAEVELLLLARAGLESAPVLLLTHAAGRLPGLVEALQALTSVHPSAETKLPQIKATEFDEFDFGENLLIHDDEPRRAVHTLAPDTPARAAHGLAEAFQSGALARGHVETIVPLERQAASSGPPAAVSKQPKGRGRSSRRVRGTET